MGSFLEVSKVAYLGLLLAESKGLANCREGSVQDRAIILLGIRRQLSLVAARAVRHKKTAELGGSQGLLCLPLTQAKVG